MTQREKKEEKNKRIGWLTSVGIQLVLLVLFYFLIAWREPFPPIPEFGIELGFTNSSGQPTSQSQASLTNEQENEEPVESVIEQVSDVTEDQSEEIPKEQEVVEAMEEPVEVVTNEIQDLAVEEQQVEQTIVEPIKEEDEVVDERAVMSSSEEEIEEDDTNSDGETNTEIDNRSIYGNQGRATGTSEGASLSLAGWQWDFKPEPDDRSDESGRIEYKIVVDQDGYLVKIEIISSSVSPSVERKYRQAVQKLTFSRTTNSSAAPLSTGTITFIIKSK